MGIGLAAISQNLFVYDQVNGNPIPNVAIFNYDHSITNITNEVGLVSIANFSDTSFIYFQHPSYELIKLTKEDIEIMNYKVSLMEKQVNLGEIVVSASRWEMKSNEIPNKIEKIREENIVFNNPQTSADMLADGNQVFVQKSQLGGGSPMIRGFAANKILFVVDGVRMNNAIYRSGNLQNVLQADVNSLNEAEVIFGPGTNIYGSDALGGVIDFHTLSPEFNIGNKAKTSGSAMARVSSADFERTVNANINIANNRWAFLGNITYSKFGDLKMGGMHNEYTLRPDYVETIDNTDTIIANSDPEVQKYSGYSQLSAMAKLGHKFSDKINWEYGLYLTQTSEVPRYDRLIQTDDNGKLKYAVWEYYPQQWLMNRLEIDMSNNASWYDNSRLVFGYQNIKEGRDDRKYQDNWLRKRNECVNVFSFNTDFDKSLNNGSFLYYGLELIYNHVDSEGIEENIITRETNNIASRYPDGGTKYFQSGLYLSYKKNFEAKPLTFLAGVRYSYVSLNSKFIDTTFYDLPYNSISLRNSAITGSAGLVFHPNGWQLNVNLSSGFRAPNLDDVAKIFDSEPGNVIVPNENLKPEYLYNIDLGLIRTFENKSKIELSGFYSYLVDAMIRGDFTLNGKDSIWYDGELSKVQAVQNIGYAHIYGGSINFNIVLTNHLRLSSVLTYIIGEDENGDAIRHAPPLYGNTNIVFNQKSLKLQFGVNYNGEVSYDRLAPTERSKAYLYATDSNGNPYSPDWWTLNFKGSYKFSDNFNTTFGIDNIMNYRYRAYSSGITAPGRNFIIAFRYNF